MTWCILTYPDGHSDTFRLGRIEHLEPLRRACERLRYRLAVVMR